jgi:hypothetical protein
MQGIVVQNSLPRTKRGILIREYLGIFRQVLRGSGYDEEKNLSIAGNDFTMI